MQKKSRAKKYARALFDIALEEGSQQKTGEELRNLSSTSGGSEQLTAALVNPMFDLKRDGSLERRFASVWSSRRGCGAFWMFSLKREKSPFYPTFPAHMP